MKTIKVRNLVIGEGMPKICVPLMGDVPSVLKTAKEIVHTHGDLVEWRIDTDPEKEINLMQKAGMLRDVLGDLPLLCTLRTCEEGGCAAVSDSEYKAINEQLISSGFVDLIDIEFSKEKETVTGLLSLAEKYQVKTVLSSHNFEFTPSSDELVEKLTAMQRAGGDLVKIAVMPQSDDDVVQLLLATWEMKKKYPTTPVITMSMGQKGMFSRVCGELFGSDVTFAAYEKASAPGQLHVEEVYEIMEKMHGEK